ncbi:MAG: hypothetical protein ABI670_19505 [Chloroflexota bacterium]
MPIQSTHPAAFNSMKHPLITLFVLVGIFAAAPPTMTGVSAQTTQNNCTTFPETGKSLCGRFMQYWREHGGISQQGFPLSGEFQERSDIDGKTYTVQYFERAVFEYHPENKAPYDVLLSLLGTKRLKEKWPQGAPDTDPTIMTGESQTFPQTGKTVSGIFLDYWRKNGGLAQQGYPLTNPLYESLTRTTPLYVVQYFERAIFELHSDSNGKPIVLLSRLGADQFARKYPKGEPIVVATPPPGGDVWASLRARPLNLPTVAAGGQCPATPGKQVSPDFGLALGSGPVYPVGFGADGVYPIGGTNEEGGWLYIKVLWVADPAYNGPALVRGRQVDGAGEMRFERGANPATELQLAPDTALTNDGTWPNWPTYTRLKGPGCYSYQIDGTNFSKVITFRAEK